MPKPPVIAVIEDDAAMREALSELLEVLAFACVVFDRAEAFLAAHSRGPFDCLITDLHLPGISGLELQRKLKVLGSSIPVIVITSSRDSLSRNRAMQEGAFAYLTKPFSDEALIGHVKAALNEIDRLRKPAGGQKPSTR
ncbi:response regulator transcription factor [Dongia sedimenti]|uniref:Response regulator n=1 Tax=Dongia sedimenti TaxID=3064282 RepID=A0ABU0YRX0_9PROT|nr:response regulator [Rhodospirillaceae bacterium R-7]